METKTHKTSGSSKYTEDYSIEPPKKFTLDNVYHWSSQAKKLEKINAEMRITKNIFLKSRKIIQENRISKTGMTDLGNKRWLIVTPKKDIIVLYSKAHDSYFCDCRADEITKLDTPCEHSLAAEFYEMLNENTTNNTM